MNTGLEKLNDMITVFTELITCLDNIEIDKCELLYKKLFDMALPNYIDEQISYSYDLFLILDMDNAAILIRNIMTYVKYHI